MRDEHFENLRGRRLLIVEDEYMIAADLAQSLEDAGVDVIGPAGSVEDALNLMEGERFDGAILDINLRNEKIYPVADRLAERGVPFVFLTGYDDLVIPYDYASVPRCNKPVDKFQLAKLLSRREVN